MRVLWTNVLTRVRQSSATTVAGESPLIVEIGDELGDQRLEIALDDRQIVAAEQTDC